MFAQIDLVVCYFVTDTDLMTLQRPGPRDPSKLSEDVEKT
jgi:hypothetical protein